MLLANGEKEQGKRRRRRRREAARDGEKSEKAEGWRW